jgi:hypothetical protein
MEITDNEENPFELMLHICENVTRSINDNN